MEQPFPKECMGSRCFRIHTHLIQFFLKLFHPASKSLILWLQNIHLIRYLLECFFTAAVFCCCFINLILIQ